MSYRTTAQIKELALLSARRYRAEYNTPDADVAYVYAIARCGYENPTSSADTDYLLKQFWLIELMKLWFYNDFYDEYLPFYDFEDSKISQVKRDLDKKLERAEDAFREAKEATQTAHLFMSAGSVFGEMVAGTGLKDDMAGTDYRVE